MNARRRPFRVYYPETPTFWRVRCYASRDAAVRAARKLRGAVQSPFAARPP